MWMVTIVCVPCTCMKRCRLITSNYNVISSFTIINPNGWMIVTTKVYQPNEGGGERRFLLKLNILSKYVMFERTFFSGKIFWYVSIFSEVYSTISSLSRFCLYRIVFVCVCVCICRLTKRFDFDCLFNDD